MVFKKRKWAICFTYFIASCQTVSESVLNASGHFPRKILYQKFPGVECYCSNKFEVILWRNICTVQVNSVTGLKFKQFVQNTVKN